MLSQKHSRDVIAEMFGSIEQMLETQEELLFQILLERWCRECEHAIVQQFSGINLEEIGTRLNPLFEELLAACDGKHTEKLMEYDTLVEDRTDGKMRAYFKVGFRLGRIFERQRKALLLGE